MEDATHYFTATCVHCGNHIEFPDDAVGRMVDCPHCGQRTQLRTGKSRPQPEVPPAEPESEAKTAPASAPEITVAPPLHRANPRLLGLCAGGLLIVLIALAAFLKPKRTEKATAPTNATTTAAVAANPTNAPGPLRPKALLDLKVGDVKLEKTTGSSLVYVVGVLTNDSGHQRFGVKIEFDLLGPQGEKLATTQDYKDVIEPHKTWEFRALVIDPKTASAKVARIKEDE